MRSSKRSILNLSVIGIILGGGTMAMLILTALETAAIANYTFKIAALEERVNELKSANSVLETGVNQQESMVRLDEAIQDFSLFKISTVDYLAPKENIIVAK